MLSRIWFGRRFRHAGTDAESAHVVASGHRLVWRPVWQYQSGQRPTGWWRAL
ncbi:hypothetical protein [Mycolicibacterium anyangense]|uniref:hypothetical protein n=1 Tax=Mycolicibacterium anyangense TaxID=1431246 RepID=UPI0013D3BFE0|nr:hypothetical protein [Mycolicibacterium anyangense]